MSDDIKSRAEFEAIYSAPPFGMSVARFPDDEKRYPGQYKNYGTQLAWSAWRARGAMLADCADEIAKLQSDVIRLRRLAAIRGAGIGNLYHDDGELQDTTDYPHIDWMRDSVDEIERALDERARRALPEPGGAE